MTVDASADHIWTVVALLAEGVGRNQVLLTSFKVFQVALLAEGVGRNQFSGLKGQTGAGRPPRGGRG